MSPPRPACRPPGRTGRAGLALAVGGGLFTWLVLALGYAPLVGFDLSSGLERGLTLANGLGAIVVGTLLLCALAAWVGASCVRPRGRGARRGVLLVLLTVVATSATALSPVIAEGPATVLASIGAALGTCTLGGAALLAWPERPEA